jgi:hypothetical protein
MKNDSVVVMSVRDALAHFLGHLLEQRARLRGMSAGHFPAHHLVEPADAHHFVRSADIGHALNELAARFIKQRRPLLRTPAPAIAQQRIVTLDRLPRDSIPKSSFRLFTIALGES